MKDPEPGFEEEDFASCEFSEDGDAKVEDNGDSSTNDLPTNRTRLFTFRPPYGARKIW